VLRYFESLEFSLVGTALGVGEGAARMRVGRALEKLRGILQRRGLTTTSAALAGALAELSAIAVPVHLAAGIASTALTQAATTAAGSVTSIILKLLAMKKIALVTVGVLAVSLATVVVVKTAHKSPRRTSAVSLDDWLKEKTPGVRRVGAKFRVTLAPGETLVTGGWPLHAGRRLFVFITPAWMDSKGKKVQAPQGIAPQVVIDAKFVEPSEQYSVSLGLQPLFVPQNESKVAVKYSSAQMRPLMDAISAVAGDDILSSPRVITTVGCQSSLSSGGLQIIEGKAQTLGLSADLLPSVSSDGISVDLAGDVRYAAAVSDSSSQAMAQ
jgi:hypothetical protein